MAWTPLRFITRSSHPLHDLIHHATVEDAALSGRRVGPRDNKSTGRLISEVFNNAIFHPHPKPFVMKRRQSKRVPCRRLRSRGGRIRTGDPLLPKLLQVGARYDNL